tara:strand:- start:8712 stop:8912 length:201 start_codon:yes stop_codon:yes gene_type:complete
VFSKINEKAKKEEIKAKIAVKHIVRPMLEYLVISNLGHFSIISTLTPEHASKNRLKKLIFIFESIL